MQLEYIESERAPESMSDRYPIHRSGRGSDLPGRHGHPVQVDSAVGAEQDDQLQLCRHHVRHRRLPRRHRRPLRGKSKCRMRAKTKEHVVAIPASLLTDFGLGERILRVRRHRHLVVLPLVSGKHPLFQEQ